MLDWSLLGENHSKDLGKKSLEELFRQAYNQ